MGDFAQGVDDLTRMDLGLATFDRRTRILFHELPLDVSFQKKTENFSDFFTQFFSNFQTLSKEVAEDQEGL